MKPRVVRGKEHPEMRGGGTPKGIRHFERYAAVVATGGVELMEFSLPVA